MIAVSVQADQIIKNIENTLDLTKNLAPVFMKIIGQPNDTNQTTIRGGFARQFFSQGSYFGQGWAPLKPNYFKRKAKKYPGLTTLVRAGTLAQSLMGSGQGQVLVTEAKRLTYGTSLSYAKYHQYGTRKMVPRQVIGVTPEQVQTWKALIAQYIKQAMEGAEAAESAG